MSYVNFPHQINDVDKLVKMLQVAKELIDSGKLLDDSTYGYEMFNRGLIASRLGYKVKQLQQMEPNRQPPVMTAREIKRTFRLFGFLEEYGGSFSLTARGKRLLKADAKNNSELKTLIWREALLNLKFHSATDHENTYRDFRFRPLYVMMRLLEHQSLERRLLVFALTVSNESEAEIARINEIIDNIKKGRSTFAEEIKKLGISESNAKNNVKILPTLAITTGLFQAKNDSISLTEFGRGYLDYERKRKPVWYSDLDSDEQRRQCKAGILLSLQDGDVEKETLDRILTANGFDASILNDSENIEIIEADGKYSLNTPISIDTYQDIPTSVRQTSNVFMQLLPLIKSGKVTKNIPVVKAKTGETAEEGASVPVVYRRKKVSPRMLSDRDQLSRKWAPPAISIVEQLQRTAALKEKTDLHQETVKIVFDMYQSKGNFELSDACYDLAAKKNNIVFVHEIKTITTKNEAEQVKKAVGQLLYYEYFESSLKGLKVIKVITFDKKPSDAAHVEFLKGRGILVFWVENNLIVGEESSMSELTHFLECQE